MDKPSGLYCLGQHFTVWYTALKKDSTPDHDPRPLHPLQPDLEYRRWAKIPKGSYICPYCEAGERKKVKKVDQYEQILNQLSGIQQSLDRIEELIKKELVPGLAHQERVDVEEVSKRLCNHFLTKEVTES